MALEDIVFKLKLPSLASACRKLFYGGLLVIGLAGCGNNVISKQVMAETYSLPRLSFISAGSAQDSDIFTMDMEGNDIRQLTNAQVSAAMRERELSSRPTNILDYGYMVNLHSQGHSWSSDGHRIVFESNRDGPTGKAGIHRERELYSMQADGSDVQRLTNDLRNRHDISWYHKGKYSTDGKKILFEFVPMEPLQYWEQADEPARLQHLFVMDSDGKNVQILIDDVYVSCYEWRPKSDEVLICNASPPATILVRSLRGDTRKIAEGHSARWSHDGNSIAYINNKGNALVTVDHYGNDELELASGNLRIANPQWFPDDTKLLFLRERNNKGMLLYSINTIDGDRTDMQTIYSGELPFSPESVTLSPDGKFAAFITNASPEMNYKREVQILNLERRALHTIMSSEDRLIEGISELQWQPQ